MQILVLIGTVGASPHGGANSEGLRLGPMGSRGRAPVRGSGAKPARSGGLGAVPQ